MTSQEILVWLAGLEDECLADNDGAPGETAYAGGKHGVECYCGGSGKVARYRLLREACRCWCHDEWKEPFIGHLSDCPEDGTSHQVIIPLDDAALAVAMRQLREKGIVASVTTFNIGAPTPWAWIGPLTTAHGATEVDALLAAWYEYEEGR